MIYAGLTCQGRYGVTTHSEKNLSWPRMQSPNSKPQDKKGNLFWLKRQVFKIPYCLLVVVMVAIRLVGILIINSLLVLPAAASRNVARSVGSYTALSIAISILAGTTGLFASYYWGTASGATIVLFAVGCYTISALTGRIRHKSFI